MKGGVEGKEIGASPSPPSNYYYYYGICFGGGMLSSGATHFAITPLDVLKVNMQVSHFTSQFLNNYTTA
ncbi:phosphate carrier protein [Trifolium medium]|uniref:Phosphate carrier protein n=1 Tax=Trifolium medium TaxID=97028 RepID=A0A392RE14_9FABA|nr:phosphate carrier protein [Trifolium medium]